MKTSVLFIILISIPFLAKPQARTGVGLNVGAIKPFDDRWKGGQTISLNADFRVSNSWAVKLGTGINKLSRGYPSYPNNAIHYTGGMVFLTLEGKYYVKRNWFATAGLLSYVAGDGGFYGGNAAIFSYGYRANLDKHFSFDLSPVLYIIKANHTAGAIAAAGFTVSLYYSSALKN
ncbi:MAG: hypothetical protein QM791_12335 [Ferruginibacter sp.]